MFAKKKRPSLFAGWSIMEHEDKLYEGDTCGKFYKTFLA
jgi:hypothetical protein